MEQSFFFFWQNGDLYVPFFLYSSFNAFLRSSLVTLDRTATTWWPFLHSQLATLSSSATRQAASEFLLKPAGGGWVDGLFDPHPKWLQQQMGAWIGWCSLFYLGKKKKKNCLISLFFDVCHLELPENDRDYNPRLWILQGFFSCHLKNISNRNYLESRVGGDGRGVIASQAVFHFFPVPRSKKKIEAKKSFIIEIILCK